MTSVHRAEKLLLDEMERLSKLTDPKEIETEVKRAQALANVGKTLVAAVAVAKGLSIAPGRAAPQPCEVAEQPGTPERPALPLGSSIVDDDPAPDDEAPPERLAKVPPPKRGGPRKPLSEEARARIVELYRAGAPLREIGEAVGVSRSAINKTVRERIPPGERRTPGGDRRSPAARAGEPSAPAAAAPVAASEQEPRSIVVPPARAVGISGKEQSANGRKAPSGPATEAAPAGQVQVRKQRRCLGCDEMFDSAWAGERRCKKCRGMAAFRETGMDEYEYEGLPT